MAASIERAADRSPEVWLSTHRAACICISLVGVALGFSACGNSFAANLTRI